MQCFLLTVACILTSGCTSKVSTPPSHTSTLKEEELTHVAAAGTQRGRICTGAAGEVQGMNCIPADLASKNQQACRGEGQDREAKDLSRPCCQGLTAISSVQPLTDGSCGYSAPPSVQICTRCGDHVCGMGENRCNCAQDCHSH